MTIDTKLTFEYRDEFGRERIADQLIKLLTSDIDISPMVIDGDWGTGKTEFCHKIINKIKENEGSKYRPLYIDVFQADHADNALMTLIASVMTLLPEGSKKKNFLNKALPVVRFGLSTVLKAGVSHALKQSTDELADGVGEALEKAANTTIDATIKAVLKDHEKANENLLSLKEALREIAKENPIIIFVDELDRCRPDFAIQILETIKHIFDVENVKFVLVTNSDQLKAAISHRYGSLVDAQRYLDKFLKFSFKLPNYLIANRLYESKSIVASVEYFYSLIKNSKTLNDTFLINKSYNEVCSFTKKLIYKNNLSLREVETFSRYLEIYHQLSNNGLNKGFLFPVYLFRVFGVFVSCFNSKLSNSIKNNNIDGKEVLNAFKIQNFPSSSVEDRQDWSYFEHMALILVQSCAINNDFYLIKEEDKEGWDRVIYDYFQGRKPYQENVFEIVKEVIYTLELGESVG